MIERFKIVNIIDSSIQAIHIPEGKLFNLPVLFYMIYGHKLHTKGGDDEKTI